MYYFILGNEYHVAAQESHSKMNDILEMLDGLEDLFGKDRWFSIARTDIEKGFMSIARGLSLKYTESCEKKLAEDGE